MSDEHARKRRADLRRVDAAGDEDDGFTLGDKLCGRFVDALRRWGQECPRSDLSRIGELCVDRFVLFKIF